MTYNQLNKRLKYYRLLVRYIFDDKESDNNKYIKDLLYEITKLDRKLKSIDSSIGTKSTPGGKYDPGYLITIKRFNFFKWVRKLWQS